ncbi:uncharacterized protein LOC108630715 isoform X3 [Ceratina calcarata]|uniref:Uncharacterized protein LOC108630715 isoform X3 n=1 Tax=Ceratina calcarata TaxID=156304 RepID=A0AAJ7S9T6_9HYME|nr:uncharacterized protein LOC108630715 isoform X3 [Ceratina calcarata]
MSTTDVFRIAQQGSNEEEQGRLKADLQYLRRRGLLKASGELSYQGRKCTRCGAPFGRFYNTGAPCARCRHRVCRQCRIEVRSPTDNKDVEWICNVCYKIAELHIVDKWTFDDSLSRSVNGKGASPVELLKRSIRRAWTINGPPTRWSAARKSPELRIYRSLPLRHQDYREIINKNEVAKLEASSCDRKESISDTWSDSAREDACERNESSEKLTQRVNDGNERTKRTEKSSKQEEEVPSDAIRAKRCNKTKNEEQEDTESQEPSTQRISLIKPPKILSKFISPDIKSSQPKHGERKSNIPIFKRSSKEFEDIRSPQESPKRSLIPQRYRGSTDDLRRSREDISLPSLIPKLLSPRSKEDRLKRQDSKDDVRCLSKPRRDSKEEVRGTTGQCSTGIRLFRRDNSREDVGRDTIPNANSSVAAKGKQTVKEEKPECVGVTTTSKPKSTVELARASLDGGNSSKRNCEEEQQHEKKRVRDEMLDVVVNDEKLLEEREGVKKEENEERNKEGSMIEEAEALENDKNADSMKEESLIENSDNDVTALERKEPGPGKKSDDFQVVRRKFSKEEFSNPDDTDDTPNKRCSSHLSPEASPLSTRSSRYSPRESESEPTPALPRKTGDSSSASQRIRDAITRTRRESNSSTRYESSGSESVRLSETGLYGYVELTRKVKFFGGSGTIPSTIGSDEVVQRDSATSAGEDEPHDDNHPRTGPVSSQGRTMLRRRRQFDAQGSRRRGRSHARTCCAEELQSFQALIGRDGGQQSPTGNQDQPLVDYRRLVFISSDSSSGREEDDADSSCSSSSYLNGLPRAGSRTQSLEDCDWDYFESGSLPLPAVTIGTNNVGTDTSSGQDWSCCPGRGPTACQTCGGSRGANVLPVPVPIPVPVPYPVPVPASLWTSDFAAAANSMISRSNDGHVEPGTLRLRGDPAAPWFAWHPRFNQPLHGARLDPRLTGVFDPCTFRPDQLLPPLYGSNEALQRLTSLQINQDETDEAKPVETFHEADSVSVDQKIVEQPSRIKQEESKTQQSEVNDEEGKKEEASCQEVSVSFERRGQRMFQHEDSGSSSGRSSADSSDLEDDSSSHRFSRVFVVNDDSLTSDNDIEDNGDEDEDSDSAAENGITLKRVTALPDEEPVVLQYVRFLSEDSSFEEDNRRMGGNRENLGERAQEANDKKGERRKGRGRKYNMENEKRISLSSQQREMPEEMYIASDNDCSDNQIELKSIKILDPDSIEPVTFNNASNETMEEKQFDRTDESVDLDDRTRSTDGWDSNIIPDSLEISADVSNSTDFSNLESIHASTPMKIHGNDCEPGNDNRGIDNCLSLITSEEGVDRNDAPSDLNSSSNVTGFSGSDSFTSNETNTTGSEVSSDELHEYEVTPGSMSAYFENSATNHELPSRLREEETSRYDVARIAKNDDESGIEQLRDTNGVASACTETDSMPIDSTIGTEDDRSVTAKDGQGDDDPDRRESKSAGADVVGDAFADGSRENTGRGDCAHDGFTVRGDSPEQVEGGRSGGGEGGSGTEDSGDCACEEGTEEEGSTRFRSVERRPSTGKENGFPPAAWKDQTVKELSQRSTVQNNNNNNLNKYRSLVMITQEASYQPVSVITSDTTTLLQPDEVHTANQGLAGYFQLALEAVSEQPHRKNGQGPRKPLMVKRLASVTANHSEAEADSGLSVGSASESDDVSVKNAARIAGNRVENNEDARQANETAATTARARASSQSSDDNSAAAGLVILEEGLADDDSWVEEVSHDEDETGGTTATEESSEDEANNLGDREEELRGYHRQAIDFTLHTIVEESCEESEAEPSLATGSPSKKQRPPSASELEKYFFFGLGGEGNNSSLGSREVDSLSETSSIYSEGLESLGQDESPGNGQSQERSNSGEGFLNSSRLEKYFLSEFLGFDQDRRDSDGSVGSDSEGRPSPEAQRRKKLVRARGTGRSHSSSLDNLLALSQNSQNLSSQNSLQDLSLNQDTQETQSEGSSTETDGADDGQTAAFGTDGQFDTVKRKKKKPRNLGTQSPRVPDDRNKTPEPSREMVFVGEVVMENEAEAMNSEDSERAKTPQPESVLGSSSSPSTTANNSGTSTSLVDSARSMQMNSGESLNYNQRSKQHSRDSGFVGSCDDLLQHQKLPDDAQGTEINQENRKDRSNNENGENGQASNRTESLLGEKGNATNKMDHPLGHSTLPHLPNASLSRKDSFNNWSSDEETNLMMSKMRQFFKTMVANSNGQNQNTSANSSGPSPAPSPRLPGYSSKARMCSQNRTKPPQLVYFENELTRLMKTVPGIRDEQVREIVEYLSSEDTWSDSYDSSDYTSSDLEGAAGGRRSALQEQISQSCQQIISKFDTTSGDDLLDKEREDKTGSSGMQPCLGRDTAFVYQKLVQSFTKMAGDGVSSDANSTPHSSPPLIAKVMHHIGSRLVALMHEVSEGGPAVQHHTWRRYSQHHRTPSSASTTEDDDSTSDSTNAPSSTHLQLPRSKSHDPLLLINSHPAASTGQEGEEREASDYERFSWRGSFESALMAADSRTKLSLLACSGDSVGGASASANALAMAAKRRSAGDLLFNPKSFSREQLDRVRSCGSIGGGSGGATSACGGSAEERIWSNRRRSSVPDANTRGESGDEDTEDELEYAGESRATTLPRGMQSAITAATNSLPRLPASTAPASLTTTSTTSSMHKAHSVYHFLPQHSGVKSARYRPPGFARNSNVPGSIGPKRALSAPGLQVSGSQSSGKRENSRSRRQQAMSLTPDDGSSLSEACSTPIIGAGSRSGSSTVIDVDDMDSGLHSGHLATRASLSSLGARSDSMASVYSGAGEGRCCRSVVVTGEVEFSLQYDYKHLMFEVHVTKCKNLAPVDVKRKRSDPYVKVYLLPDKSKSGKRKTKVKKHTLNPEFNETLKFHMSLSGLETRTLWLTVWHSDMFGRNDFLGEVRMPLENKIFDDPTPKWYPLQERTEPFDDPIAYKGEVIVGLKFVPPDPTQQERDREIGSDRGVSKSKKNWSRGSLHVLVKEARNLQTRAKNSGTCDPFCKSYLLPDKGRSGKQKTGVVRRSGGSPVWNHTFVYKDVSLQELAERGLELTVWDHDRIASNEFLGGVRFNLGTGKHYGKPVDWMDATGRELSLWQSMLERPNFWVEGAVTLRPNLHNHGKNNSS